MNKPIINGVDVSEEIRYCNNCSNLGLDFKAHKFYCSLSHRPDELPEVLSCDEFNTNCYIKRLQEENEELKEKITKFRWDNPYYDLYNNVVGQRDNLKKENEELKKENKNYARLMLEQQEVSRKYWECIEKIKQAIEVLAETCNIYPLKTNLDKLITTINEVLDDN